MKTGVSARRYMTLWGTIAVVLTLLHAYPSFAAARQPSLNIPSVPLGDALTAFGKQTGSEVLFLPSLITGKRSQAISGRYASDKALGALLSGTGLTFRYNGDGVYLIEREPVSAAAPQRLQAVEPTEDPPVVVIVRGYRASAAAGAQIKKKSVGIVDAVVATDIGKLPDDNAAEALQRVAGVQVSRSQGEGSLVTVRGLTQIRSELDGRSIFTPSSGGRTLNFEDMPSQVLAGIEVRKTPSADQIEGGLSGTVNLRLRRPFDFKGFSASGQARTAYYDNADRDGYDLSGLLTDRWSTARGEMGVLVSASSQRTAYRSDFDVGGAPKFRTDIIDLNQNGQLGDDADEVAVPNGGGIAMQFGTRERSGIDFHFQWRPADNVDVSADAFHYSYRFQLNAILLFALSNPLEPARPVDITVFPGTNLFQSGTFQNATLDTNAFTSNRRSDVSHLALKTQWRQGPWQASLEGAYGTGKTDSAFQQLGLTSSLPNPETGAAYGNIPQVHQDFTADLPTIAFRGLDLTSASSFLFERAIQYLDDTRGTEASVRGDASYRLDRGPVTRLKVGFRIADRRAEEDVVYNYQDLGGAPLGAAPELVDLTELNLFRSTPNPIRTRFWAPRVSSVQAFDRVLNAFNLPSARESDAPVAKYDIRETSWALYALANYKLQLAGFPIEGDAGLRLVRTRSQILASGQDTGALMALSDVRAKALDLLPQLNVKMALGPNLNVRGAAYASLTRQDFSLLSPKVTLDYLFHTGAQGNPNLEPMRATNIDLALEYDHSLRETAYLDVFYKQVTGFVQNEIVAETFDGQSFAILRPKNGPEGDIWGYELGFTRFLTTLPAPWNGIGVQASYTEVSSSTPSPVSASKIPLEGLSKNSYNLILIYETGKVSARLAYNWRSRYVISSALNNSGYASDWSRAQGILDASLNLAVTKRLKLTADISNLSNAQTRTYFGDPRAKHNATMTDRRLAVGLRYSF